MTHYCKCGHSMYDHWYNPQSQKSGCGECEMLHELFNRHISCSGYTGRVDKDSLEKMRKFMDSKKTNIVDCHKVYYHKDIPYNVWKNSKNHVYIGRHIFMRDPNARVFDNTKWLNPYKVKQYGRKLGIQMYRDYVVNRPNLMSSLHELKGKVLGCWCVGEIPIHFIRENKVCHGEVLLELLSRWRRSN